MLEALEAMGYKHLIRMSNVAMRTTAKGKATAKAIPIHYDCPVGVASHKGSW